MSTMIVILKKHKQQLNVLLPNDQAEPQAKTATAVVSLPRQWENGGLSYPIFSPTQSPMFSAVSPASGLLVGSSALLGVVQ